MPTYIPAGRTSIVHRDEGSFQIQTEYAYRPYPRITTSIILNGQVVHKKEQKLNRVIGSIEEQNKVQDRIQKQHFQIAGYIKNGGLSQAESVSLLPDSKQHIIANSNTPEKDSAPIATVKIVASSEISEDQKETASKPYPTSEAMEKVDQAEETPNVPIKDMLNRLKGFEYLFLLGSDGDFRSEASRVQFTKLFKKIAKSVTELTEIFPKYPGEENQREQGVYEVKRDRLYFVSTGESCFFVTVRPSGDAVEYEQVLKEMFVPTELRQMLNRMRSKA